MGQYEIGQTVTNEYGATATLRYDPNGGRHYEGVYWVDEWAPYFPANEPCLPSAYSTDRAKTERAMAQWLKNAGKN